jgi:excisionase family DNA binding protein
MTETAKTLTSAEFSERTGLSVSTVTKMLRQGRLRGEKRGGKWAIFESEATNFASTSVTPAPAPTRGETYPIETFVQMTYLTEKGVRQFLKTGRLTGGVDDQGRLMVDAANLKRPELRHLIRS